MTSVMSLRTAKNSHLTIHTTTSPTTRNPMETDVSPIEILISQASTTHFKSSYARRSLDSSVAITTTTTTSSTLARRNDVTLSSHLTLFKQQEHSICKPKRMQKNKLRNKYKPTNLFIKENFNSLNENQPNSLLHNNNPLPSTHFLSDMMSTSCGGVVQSMTLDYTLQQRIGCGGSSSVFTALHNKSGEKVVIKKLNCFTTSSYGGHDHSYQEYVQRCFVNEVQKLKSLRNCEFSVQIIDSILTSHNYDMYIVLKYEEGVMSLDQWIQHVNSQQQQQHHDMIISESCLRELSFRLLNILNQLHQNHKLVHRDIKPSNILVKCCPMKPNNSESNRPSSNGSWFEKMYLCDFAFASSIAPDANNANERHFDQSCTEIYGSPQKLMKVSHCHSSTTVTSGTTDPLDDIWSAGISILEVILGHSPLATQTNGFFHQDILQFDLDRIIRSHPRKFSHLSTAFISFLSRCLSVPLEERYNAFQLMELLKSSSTSMCPNVDDCSK
ncbi:hypothetical protein C9374_008193 [Naegleria lovaniensis]|uniref:Protein kinase domain-containing protein n=1 Tax=Naegleria lovaniensis TaxID=51637 RepID=A0AA88KL69_NAELO|nr:uncharacterized protein C9374_008193 [Naegleria lovaniensis]KAG2378554.1 hypothetical protein C9374_008193 [Naegleria lovaniensis]